MAPVTSRKAPLTMRSTHLVSQLLTERGTISVPTAPAPAVSTSKAPATAATERPISGTTTKFSRRSMTARTCRATAPWHGRPRIGRRKFTAEPQVDVRRRPEARQHRQWAVKYQQDRPAVMLGNHGQPLAVASCPYDRRQAGAHARGEGN